MSVIFLTIFLFLSAGVIGLLAGFLWGQKKGRKEVLEDKETLKLEFDTANRGYYQEAG